MVRVNHKTSTVIMFYLLTLSVSNVLVPEAENYVWRHEEWDGDEIQAVTGAVPAWEGRRREWWRGPGMVERQNIE